MQSHDGFFGPNSIWLGLGLVCAIFLAWRSFAPAPPPPGEALADLTVGTGVDARIERISRQDCVKQEGRVWVAFEDGVECISYVATRVPSGTDIAVMFLDGDVPEAQLAQEMPAAARAKHQGRADSLAQRFGVPVVVVGRPGLMGSTGHHLAGGRRDEAAAIDGAIDQIKEKLGIRRLALAGQSGGARLIAQLMVGGRRDIACAAMASGAYDVPRLRGGGVAATSVFGDPGRRYLVPMRDIEKVAASPSRRSFVIGDARDTVTPFPEQREWADRLQKLGHHAELIEAEGRGSSHHGLSEQALTAAALCAKGESDQQIRKAVMGR